MRRTSKYGFIFNSEKNICEKAGYFLLKSTFTPSVHYSNWEPGTGYDSGEIAGWRFRGLYRANKNDFISYDATFYAKDSQLSESVKLFNRQEAVEWWQTMDGWDFHLTDLENHPIHKNIEFDKAFDL